MSEVFRTGGRKIVVVEKEVNVAKMVSVIVFISCCYGLCINTVRESPIMAMLRMLKIELPM